MEIVRLEQQDFTIFYLAVANQFQIGKDLKMMYQMAKWVNLQDQLLKNMAQEEKMSQAGPLKTSNF